ncbi:hypothetical protein MTR67_046825 [Solanum verrucosum]|uniref:RNase H type-1 domain-containing protein n=1 Tax=Solanum verrucosum TaxID=315347 RepID=A0AAF0UVB9_SOLVR|nr:hypothetical protein MTR67_046825 [Solanum verrucosum]
MLVELRAFHVGQIRFYNLVPLAIETDSKEIINTLQQGNDCYSHLIDDSRYLMHKLRHHSPSTHSENANGVVDGFAKHGARMTINENSMLYHVRPSFVVSTFINDCMGSGYFRKITVASTPDAVISPKALNHQSP